MAKTFTLVTLIHTFLKIKMIKNGYNSLQTAKNNLKLY